MFIASEASDAISNATWKAVFDFYTPELLEGSTYPDQVSQDWDNHLYYPHNKTHNAPTAAARLYNYTRDNFTAGNWEDGFFSMGVMSHYFADPHIPVHTDVWWDGHSAYEGDINDNLGSLTIGTLAENVATNVSQMVVDGATYSHQFYDMVVEAYPDETSEALMTNATIKAFTESCLTKAINGCLSLFYNLTQYVEPPDVSGTLDYVALVDYAHTNDYTTLFGDQLLSLNQTLYREGFELRKQTTAFHADNFTDVDLLIITCGLDAYTAAELTAISNWAASGNKSIIITGRGDYASSLGDIDIARPNSVLASVGSSIRVNDDDVHMLGTYKTHYNDLYDILAPAETLNLTFDVSAFTMYSPASLYFIDDDAPMPVIYADHTAWQRERNGVPAPVIYDDVMDELYGDQMPLGAIEEIGTLRVLVTGTTFFSDFDYGKTATFDNIEFLENFLDWAVGNRSEFNVPSIDEMGPRINDIAWDPASPDDGQLVNVTATMTDPSGVDQMFLKYGGTTHEMNHVSGDTYEVRIPDVISGTLDFRIEANDTVGNIAIRASYTIEWTPETTTTTTTTTTTPTTTTATTTTTTPTTTAEPPPPLDIDPMLLLAVGVGALVVIVLIVILMRKR
jgi:hypothetical protein